MSVDARKPLRLVSGVVIAAAITTVAVMSAVSHVKADEPALPVWPTAFTPSLPAPQPRFEAADAAVGTTIYLFGGFSDSQFRVNRTYMSYDSATGAWTFLGTMPTGMAETHVGLTHDDRYIYFAGGFAGDLKVNQNPSQAVDNKLWRYDTVTNTFLQIPTTMPQPRGAGVLALVGRKLHYIGGNPADRVTNLADHFVYDLDTGAWTTEAPTPDPKDHASGAVIGTKIYILGGEKRHDEGHLQQNTAHSYDTATGTWTKLANLPSSKSHTEGGTYVSDGQIVMAGGQVDNFQATSTVFAYNPASNTWSTLNPSLPAPRQGAIIKQIQAKLIVALGAQFTDKPQSTVWTGTVPYTPRESPKPAPPAPSAQAAHSCHLHNDLVVRWRKPSKRLTSITVSINDLRYARIGGKRRRISIRKSKLAGVKKVSVEGRVAGTKSKRLYASRYYSSCHKPSTKALTLKPVK